MNLHVGDTVMFGPPGKPRVPGKVLRVGKEALIRQTAPGHGQPAGTEWNVPTSYVEVAREAPSRRSSKPKTKKAWRPDWRRPEGSKITVQHPTDPKRSLAWTIDGNGASVGDYDWRAGTGTLTYHYTRFHADVGDETEHEKSLGKYRSLEAASTTVFKNIDKNRARAEARKAGRGGGVTPRKTIAFTCCGKIYGVTPAKAHSIVTSGKYRCPGCKESPSFASTDDKRKYNEWLRGR
jgi:hypothetical protein